MVKILFVCYGNICRSTMAEFMMKKLVREKGLENEIFVASAATSPYEAGMSVHRGTRQILDREGITDYHDKRSVTLRKTDYEKYDYVIGMDEENLCLGCLNEDYPTEIPEGLEAETYYKP